MPFFVFVLFGLLLCLVSASNSYTHTSLQRNMRIILFLAFSIHREREHIRRRQTDKSEDCSTHVWTTACDWDRWMNKRTKERNKPKMKRKKTLDLIRLIYTFHKQGRLKNLKLAEIKIPNWENTARRIVHSSKSFECIYCWVVCMCCALWPDPSNGKSIIAGQQHRQQQQQQFGER